MDYPPPLEDVSTSHANHEMSYTVPGAPPSERHYGLPDGMGTTETVSRRKRPGPKRDSKPALSEKLERNRQAQRTHRERKELYTKQLERECLRLKDLFTEVAQERDAANEARDQLLIERDQLLEENRRLRGRLQATAPSSSGDSGYDDAHVRQPAVRDHNMFTPQPNDDVVAKTEIMAEAKNETPPHDASMFEECETRNFATEEAIAPDESRTELQYTDPRDTSAVAAPNSMALPAIHFDYDEIGLDFVLTLERPCMHHLQYLVSRAHNPGGLVAPDGATTGKPLEVPDDGENQHISGHALMVTAPTLRHVLGASDSRYPTQYPNLKRADLLKLFNLSNNLDVTDVELPPVKAWIKIMQDARIKELSSTDIDELKRQLAERVNCYRFGAVVKKHDIADVLDAIWKAKRR